MKYVARNAPPKHFLEHTHREEWTLGYPQEALWRWLNDPATFTEGQPPGFKVEFIACEENAEADFEEGVICAHFGPGMMFAGVLSEMREPDYRDLQYYYGSYALSFWIIRPTRLQFWVQKINDKESKLILQVDSYVRYGFSWLWSSAQNIFWTFFPMSLKRGIVKHLPS